MMLGCPHFQAKEFQHLTAPMESHGGMKMPDTIIKLGAHLVGDSVISCMESLGLFGLTMFFCPG